jgi:transposase-like protein
MNTETKRKLEKLAFDKKNTFVSHGGRTMYSHEFKSTVATMAYVDKDATIEEISEAIGFEISSGRAMIYKWKSLLLPNLKTAYGYGKTVRFDVKTKCVAVKRYLEDKESAEKISDEHSITVATFGNWINDLKYKYNLLLDNGIPDGVPYLVKEEKLVYGDKNINELRVKLQEEKLAIANALLVAGLNSSEKKMLKAIEKRQDVKITELDKAVATLKKYGIQG